VWRGAKGASLRQDGAGKKNICAMTPCRKDMIKLLLLLAAKNIAAHCSSRQASNKSACLRQPGLKKAKNIRSLSPPSGAPRKIGVVANDESSGPQFD